MMPPGMSFNAISDKALAANKNSKMPKSFFAWDDMLNMNKVGFFPYTPATQMLHGLDVGIEMLHEEGLDNVFARHNRLAEATRRAVKRLGPGESLTRTPKPVFADHHRDHAAGGPRRRQVPRRWRSTRSTSPTARASAPMPASISASAISATSTTAQLIGALGITEMALALAGIPHKKGGVQAAMDYIISAHAGEKRAAAE